MYQIVCQEGGVDEQFGLKALKIEVENIMERKLTMTLVLVMFLIPAYSDQTMSALKAASNAMPNSLTCGSLPGIPGNCERLKRPAMQNFRFLPVIVGMTFHMSLAEQ